MEHAVELLHECLDEDADEEAQWDNTFHLDIALLVT